MKKKNIFSFALIIIQICLLFIEPLSVYAGLFGSNGQARGGINSFIENDLNINVEKGLKPMTETINSADRKGKVPEVSVRFSTTNPKPGEIVTASADVKGISNVNDAYYMWYLTGPARKTDLALHLANGEPIGSPGESPAWHVFAIQAQAALYFDPMSLDQPMNGGSDDGEYVDEYDRITTDDKDGYKAPLGGGNASNEGDDFCYLYDVETGIQYELMPKGGEDEKTGDGCDAYDTAEIDYVARCMFDDRSISCPTKILPVEGNISTSSESSSDDEGSEASASSSTEIGGGGGARSRNLAQCLDEDVEPNCVDGKVSCPSADGSVVTEYDLDALRSQVPTPYCIPQYRSTGKLWIDPNANGCPGAAYSVCFDGEPCLPTAADQIAKCGEACSSERPNYYGSGCHDQYKNGVFKQTGVCKAGELGKPNKCPTKMGDYETEGGIRSFPDGAGDGNFPQWEERMYHLNPLTDRTTPLALNDEALVMGLGMINFTWRYEEGDEIGVIVEGKGMEATKHEDGTYQTVFALMQPGCKDILKPVGSYNVMVKDKSLNIKTGKANLNKCIIGDTHRPQRLLTSPGTSEYDALNVSISTGASKSGAAIASGIDQPMHISATAGQIQGGSISNAQKLYYEWSVTCNDQDITKDLDLSTTEGMNIPSLDFTANFPDTCFDESGQAEIKVTSKINEPRAGGGSNFGQTTQTFTVFNAKNNPLKTYKTQANGTQFSTTSEEICTEGIDHTLCRVMNNEVIAIKAPNNIENGMVSWQVNGRDYRCDSTISAECVNGNTATGTIIIPMTGRSGDIITVAANTSTVDKDTNQSAQLMRSFRITDPEVTIEPVSGAVRKVLGAYIDLDDNEHVDESSKVLIAKEGETVSLTANLYPGFLNSQEDASSRLIWTDAEKVVGAVF